MQLIIFWLNAKDKSLAVIENSISFQVSIKAILILNFFHLISIFSLNSGFYLISIHIENLNYSYDLKIWKIILKENILYGIATFIFSMNLWSIYSFSYVFK